MPVDPSNEASYPPPAVSNHGRNSLSVNYNGQRRQSVRRDAEGAITPMFLLWVFKQWWKFVVPAGLLLAVIAAALVMFFYVPKYEATALLMIEQSTPFVAFSKQEDSGNRSDAYVQTQLELLRSGVILEPVLGRAEIAAISELQGEDDRVKYLQDRLTVKQVGKSELYNIAYRSRSAQDAAKVVNAVCTEYLDSYSTNEIERSQRVIEILEGERKRRAFNVEKLRQSVIDLAKEVTGRDPFAGNDMIDLNRALSPAGALLQSLTATEVDREVRRAELQSLQDLPSLGDNEVTSTGLLDLQIENQESVRARQQAIAELEAQMEGIKIKAARYQKDPQGEADPNYVALKNELSQRQKDLSDTKAKARELILSQQREKRKEEHTQRVAQIAQDLKALDARHKLLSERVEKQLKEQQRGGEKSAKLEFARSELEREQKVFELIASRELALQTELRAPRRVILQHGAVAPTAPIEPIPYKLLLLACSGAFAAPFGLAVLREITVRRISDVEQLACESGLRVLGEIAAMPVRYVAISPNQLSGRLRRDTYVFAESINSLRTNLALTNRPDDQQVYAVTSAAPSEGKSSVAVSLALSIANATNRPTLIIDGDMRSPFVASMLKAKNQPGLFELLAKKTTIGDAIQSVQNNQLYVIPAGRATRSTHCVVDVAELKHLIEQLRPRFGTIIIDTPPILGASESLILAKVADAVLFCSLANVSTARQVRLAVDRLEHAHVNIAGAVLSGMPAKRYEYVYGYYANRIESAN